MLMLMLNGGFSVLAVILRGKSKGRDRGETQKGGIRGSGEGSTWTQEE